MTPADAAEILTLAAAFDRRTIGKADAIAWADALTGLDPPDCAEAVRAHFRSSADYLMPVHVRRGVAAIRAARIKAANSSVLDPHDVDPADVRGYIRASRARRDAIASGRAVEVEQLAPADPDKVKKYLEDALKVLPSMPAAFEVAS